jgi:hypothetical protein
MMMEAVRTSETSVYSKETIWHYMPECSNIHTRCRENLKCHIKYEQMEINITRENKDKMQPNLVCEPETLYRGDGHGFYPGFFRS